MNARWLHDRPMLGGSVPAAPPEVAKQRELLVLALLHYHETRWQQTKKDILIVRLMDVLRSGFTGLKDTDCHTLAGHYWTMFYQAQDTKRREFDALDDEDKWKLAVADASLRMAHAVP